MVTRLGRSETSGMTRTLTGTTVAIVGGGPAGLMLSHLLAIAGIESVVVELRSRREIEETHRAGILEQDSVRLLVESGVSDRVLRDGDEHEGIELAFGGELHRIDFRSLAGASCQLYPQTEVFKDLADAHAREGRDVRFGVRDVSVVDIATAATRCPLHRRRRRLPRAALRLPRRRRRVPEHLSPGRPGERPVSSTSASTPSPGSASCARRRPARRS